MSESSTKKYFMHHGPSNTTVAHLSWDQARALCVTLDSDRVNQWYIYTKGYGDWKSLDEVIFEFVKFGNDDSGTHDLPSAEKLLGDGPRPSLIEIASDRRDSPRFQRTLPLILDMHSYFIPTETEDISLSGVRLKEPKTIASKPKYIMAMIKLGRNVLHMKLAPNYTNDSGEFKILSCLSCSDTELWKGQQRDDHESGIS